MHFSGIIKTDQLIDALFGWDTTSVLQEEMLEELTQHQEQENSDLELEVNYNVNESPSDLHSMETDDTLNNS